jgi:hypothetical protein
MLRCRGGVTACIGSRCERLSRSQSACQEKVLPENPMAWNFLLADKNVLHMNNNFRLLVRLCLLQQIEVESRYMNGCGPTKLS